MHVNPAFFPMVELMPHACVPGTEDGTMVPCVDGSASHLAKAWGMPVVTVQ